MQDSTLLYKLPIGNFYTLSNAGRGRRSWQLRAEFGDLQGKLMIFRNWHAACKDNHGNNAPNASAKEFGKKRKE
jgi:hypothetical protein